MHCLCSTLALSAHYSRARCDVDMDSFAEANSIESKALRMKRFPRPVQMVSSVRASHSADFSLSDSRPPESQIRHKRPSTANSASQLLRRRQMNDSQRHCPGDGSTGYHSCAFRVTNDFVARSDGTAYGQSSWRLPSLKRSFIAYTRVLFPWYTRLLVQYARFRTWQ